MQRHGAFGAGVELLAQRAGEVPVTSSTMPTVKWFFGLALARLSYTALTMVGLNSLEPRP